MAKHRKTPTLDRHLAAAVKGGADPVAAGKAAHAELEERWFKLGDRRTLQELRSTEESLGLR